MFTWLCESVLSGKIVDKVIAELESCGFQCLIAGIGGHGLEICFGGSAWFAWYNNKTIVRCILLASNNDGTV